MKANLIIPDPKRLLDPPTSIGLDAVIAEMTERLGDAARALGELQMLVVSAVSIGLESVLHERRITADEAHTLIYIAKKIGIGTTPEVTA